MQVNPCKKCMCRPRSEKTLYSIRLYCPECGFAVSVGIESDRNPVEAWNNANTVRMGLNPSRRMSIPLKRQATLIHLSNR